MAESLTDVLMITHNRPDYTAITLPALLDGSDPQTRVWVWHNGADEPTGAVIRSLEAIDGWRGAMTTTMETTSNL